MATRKPHAAQGPAEPPPDPSPLRFVEQEYRTILHTALDGFWVLDEAERLLEVNEAYCRMSGYAATELRRLRVSELAVEDGAAESAQRFAMIRRTGQHRFEARHRRKDGTLLDVEVSVRFLDTGGGRFICFLRDITERKATEERLRLSEQRFQQAFSASPDPITISRLRDGLFHAVNEAFLASYGFRREEVIGRTSTSLGLWTEEERAEVVRAIESGGSVRNREVALRTRTGSRRTVLMSAETIQIDGEPHLVVFNRDVTERKEAQAALARWAQRLETVSRMGEDISRELDLPSVLRLIVRRASELVQAGGGAIHLWDAGRRLLVPVAWYGSAEWRRGVERRLGEGAIGIVAQRRQGLLLNGYRESAHARSETLARQGLTAVVVEPLLSRAGLVGVLGLDNEGTGRDFTGEDQRILRLFAAQAATAVENARLFEGAQQDLAERQVAEAALREGEARYRQLFESLTSAFALCETLRDEAGVIHDCRFVEVNAALERLFGKRREELVGSRVREVFSEDFDLSWLVALDEVEASGQPARFERFWRRAGFWVDVTLFRVEPGRCAAVIADITGRKQAETALREREAYLRSLFLAAPIGIGVNVRRVLSAVNETLCRMVGYSEAELVGQSARLLYPTDADFEYVGTAKYAQIRAAGVGTVETRWRRKDGAILDIQLSSSPLDPVDLGAGVVFTALDITDRKRSERWLTDRTRQLEAVRDIGMEIARELDLGRLLELLLARLRDMIDGSVGSVHLWDDDEQCLVPHVSQTVDGWRRALRMRLGEGVSGTVAQRREGMLVNDFRGSPYCTPYHAAHSRHTAVLAEPLLYRDRLLGVVTLDNEESQRGFTAADQELLRLFAVQAAIAIENARLFRETEARQERLQTLVEVSQRLTRGLDLTAVLTAIAEAAATLFKCEAGFRLLEGEQLVRRAATPGALQIMGRERLRVGESLSGRVAETGEPIIASDTASDPRLHPDHRAKVRELAGALMCLPIRVEGRILGTLLIFKQRGYVFSQDERLLATSLADQAGIAIQNARLYAEQRQAYEELRRAQEDLVRSEKLSALGQMSAGIAHDLNNMLAAVLGQVELLRLRVSDSATRESLNTLETAARDGAQVVRRLQEFARPRGLTPLRAVCLATLVGEAVELARPRWQDETMRRGVLIRVETALPRLPAVQGHEPEIREAVTNLIFNAVDAMPQGGTLTIAARVATPAAGGQAGEGAGEQVELDVRDTGVGVPEEIQARIFDPFFTTKGPRGTGLGLSVVYGIMERHGGSVAVRSTPGQGTTFTLRFQIAAAAPAASQPPESAPAVSPRRLLVAEDEDPVRSTLVQILRTSGHEVVEATDGPAALAFLAANDADCLITDLGMPGMLGWEVAAKAKALRPDLPVVLLTGWGESAAAEAGAVADSVDRILSKPVRLADLLRTIRELTDAGA